MTNPPCSGLKVDMGPNVMTHSAFKTKMKLGWPIAVKIMIFLGIMLGLTSYSCQDDPGKSTLGAEYVEPQTKYSLIDTLTLDLSTVLIDTIETTGTGVMLLGSMHDDTFGDVNVHSYCTLGIPSEYYLVDNDTFDSLNLVIKYSGYSLGDTTTSQTLQVHRLLEAIETDDDETITQNTTFAYDPNPIGEITFTPRPHNQKDSLLIRIDDAIGMDFMQRYLAGDETMTDTVKFLEYFPGLAFTMQGAGNNTILGFDAGYNEIKLVLHTTHVGETVEQLRNEFGLQDSTTQFNNIAYDFSSTPLEKLSDQDNALPASEMGGLAYLHGGIGLAIRVEIPSLINVLQFDRGIIISSELEIAPLSNSYNDVPLPSTLFLYKMDKHNSINVDGGFAVGALELDDQFHENTYYSFNMTSYIKNELLDSYVDPEQGLVIMLPWEAMATRFDQLIADNKNHLTRLLIYYLTY